MIVDNPKDIPIGSVFYLYDKGYSVGSLMTKIAPLNHFGTTIDSYTENGNYRIMWYSTEYYANIGYKFLIKKPA
jgi:hypothetical protein